MKRIEQGDSSKIDGYRLFDLLRDGNPYEVPLNGKIYRMQFVGLKYGSNNHLQVTHPDGTVGKFGWGWSSELVFRTLDNLANGIRDNYRPYQYKAENEQ